MKTLNFTYTKENGEVSVREFVEVAKPSANYQGYDITEMDNEEYFEFAKEYNTLVDKHKQELADLLVTYDLKHTFKMFKPSNMSNITTEHV